MSGARVFFGGHKNFVPSNSCVTSIKTKKKKLFTAESAKERFLLTNSGVMISILGVSSLQLHSNGTEPVTFFGVQSSLRGAQFSFGEARPRNAPHGAGPEAELSPEQMKWGGTSQKWRGTKISIQKLIFRSYGYNYAQF